MTQYSNNSLHQASKRKLDQTRRHYEQLIRAMKRAEKKIRPVLSAFYDQVLFLKHKLNARAIASLQNEFRSIESDVASLTREMEKSIAEANAFINAMENRAGMGSGRTYLTKLLENKDFGISEVEIIEQS